MNTEINNRTKWLHIRLTVPEYNKIHAGFSTSTKRRLSEYLRSILLDKPITVYTRNQSLDDFLAELILLRSELKSIGNNLNQAVKRLHTLEHHQELKTGIYSAENVCKKLLEKAVEINDKIAQISNQWSQE